MTWVKIGAEFCDELLEVSDAAFRLAVEGIAFVYQTQGNKAEEEVSLCLTPRAVRRFAGTADYLAAAAELVERGIWKDAGTGWEVVHHAQVVRDSLRAQRNQREGWRKRQAAKRSRAEEVNVTSDIPRDVTRRNDRQSDRHKNHARGVKQG